MINFLTVVKIVRIKEWLDKLLVVGIAMLVSGLFDNGQDARKEIFDNFFICLFYIIIYLSFAYMVNSIADFPEDHLAGKDKGGGLTARTLYWLAVIPGILQFAPFLLASHLSFGVILLLGLNAVSALVYSLSKMKSMEIFGLIAPTISQRPLPFLLFVLLKQQVTILDEYLFAWLTIVGFHAILFHQIKDYNNDKNAKIKTLAARLGLVRSKCTLKWVSAFLAFFVVGSYAVLPKMEATFLAALMLLLRLYNISRSYFM